MVIFANEERGELVVKVRARGEEVRRARRSKREDILSCGMGQMGGLKMEDRV